MSAVPVTWAELRLKDIVMAVAEALSEYGYKIGPGNDVIGEVYWYYEHGRDIRTVELLRYGESHRYVVSFRDNKYCRAVVVDLEDVKVKVECEWKYPMSYDSSRVAKEFEMLGKVMEKVMKVLKGE